MENDKQKIYFLPATVDVAKQVFSMYQHQGGKFWKGYTELYDFKFFVDLLKSGTYYVLVEDGEITAGCALLSEDKEMWGTTETADSVIVERFVSQKKGSGKILLAELSKFCKNNGKRFIRLGCNSSQEGLKNYYKSNGFDEIGLASMTYKLSGTHPCLFVRDVDKVKEIKERE